MYKKIRYYITAFCVAGASLYANEDQDKWILNWLKGIEFGEQFGTYQKGVEAYTAALEFVPSSEISFKLHLKNERGGLYSELLDYKNAIQDYSFVIEHPDSTTELMFEALWGRGRAYMAEGEDQKLKQDVKRLEDYEKFVTRLYETKDYCILKMNSYMSTNPKCRKTLQNVLLLRKEIASEKDVVFTPSGLTIIKKVKGEILKDSLS